jgi:mono/diheme cytochrome c family protein
MNLLAGAALAVSVGAAGTAGFLLMRKPAQAAPPAIRVEATPERLARGKYIFEVLADCGGCHSERDWSRFSAPELPGRKGVGTVFPSEMGLPGTVAASNITPDAETGIGTWTDGEKIRAIREGVSRDGRALFPMMPYGFYRSMSDADVTALVAYLNTLPPVKHKLTPTNIDFPVNILMKSAPRPVEGPVKGPNRADPVKYGEYLATMAGCLDCHTPMERGDYVADKLLAGGREFRFGKFVVNTANITPDPETGIGTWSEERFLSKFHGYRAFADGAPPKAVQSNFTLMPWMGLSQLPDEDLRAIYQFLRTAKPVYSRVDVHPELPQS